MKLSLAHLALAPALMLAACSSEEEVAVDNSEIGGEAEGEVLGGTISDDMLPLEELTSTSPPARRTVTTTVIEGEDGEAIVETTVETVRSSDEGPQPAPPAPPPQPGAAQEGGQ